MPDPTYEELLRAYRTQQENARVVRTALDAFNRGDTEAFLSNFSDDMQFQMNGSHQFSNTCHTKAEFLELVGRVVEGLSEMITLEIKKFIPAGDWVIAETYGSAKTKSGEPYHNTYCMMYRLENGKVVEFREHNDSAMVERVFGG